MTTPLAAVTTAPGRARRLAAVLAGTALLGVLGAQPAQAATSNLSTTSERTYQTNGLVRAVLTIGSRTYLAGDFTSVRPAGARAGTTAVPRARLAAVDSTTGALLPWNPGADQNVYSLAASPDGSLVYAGGNFMVAGGLSRKHVVALSAATGVPTGFLADTVGQVRTVATSGDRLYLGGLMSSVRGVARTRLAAVDTAGNVVTSWAPAAGDVVLTLAVSPDGSAVYAGGKFLSINGLTGQGRLAKLSAATGDPQPWTTHPAYPIEALVVTDTAVYVGGDGTGGHAAAFSTIGVQSWESQTDGGVQAVALLGGVLYLGGHFDQVCLGNTAGTSSGFTCPVARADRHKLFAVDAATGDTDAWNPGANSPLGVFALDVAGQRLHVGGVFTTIGGRSQQGFSAFAAPAV